MLSYWAYLIGHYFTWICLISWSYQVERDVSILSWDVSILSWDVSILSWLCVQVSTVTMAQLLGHFGYQCVWTIKTSSHGTSIGSYGAVCRALCEELMCAAKIIHSTLFQGQLKAIGIREYMGWVNQVNMGLTTFNLRNRYFDSTIRNSWVTVLYFLEPLARVRKLLRDNQNVQCTKWEAVQLVSVDWLSIQHLIWWHTYAGVPRHVVMDVLQGLILDNFDIPKSMTFDLFPGSPYSHIQLCYSMWIAASSWWEWQQLWIAHYCPIYQYNPAAGSWEVISHTHTERCNALVAVRPGNELMVVGGRMGIDTQNEVTDVVEIATLQD